MTLHPIPPPVLPPSNGNAIITKAWDSDAHTFYLISYPPAHIMLWAHTKEKGIGGRIIEPNPKTWEDLWGQEILWDSSIVIDIPYLEAEIKAWIFTSLVQYP